MGWNGFDDHDENYWDQDYIDYMNKTGIYEEPGEPDDPEDDIYLSGLNPDDLADMDEDDRRDALESVGMDPDDYDDVFIGASSGYRSSSARRTSTVNRTASTSRPSTVRSTSSRNRTSSNQQKLTGEDYFYIISRFIGGLILLAVVVAGLTLALGELITTIIIIVVGVYFISR